jgi:LysR family transcriptional regulator for bpeEF and oprC
VTIDRFNVIGSSKADTLASSFSTSYAGVLAFIAVANEGSFAKAGDRLGIGRSAVSRSVQRLEAQLDARLFHRTTRNTSLTSEGEMFLARCQPGVLHIAQALEDVRELRQGPPRGRLRVSSVVAFGRKVVAPLLTGFHAAFPEVELEFMLDDATPDFISDRIDVSFRSGRMEDSQVVARQLVPVRMHVCASPLYQRWRGVPRAIEDLADHRCIQRRLPSGRTVDWEFTVSGRSQRLLPPSAQSVFNDDELVLQAVLDGQGLAQLPAYQVSSQIEAGTLITCLDEYAPEDRGHYICYFSRKHLPARVRSFIDYMTQHIRERHMSTPCMSAAVA